MRKHSGNIITNFKELKKKKKKTTIVSLVTSPKTFKEKLRPILSNYSKKSEADKTFLNSSYKASINLVPKVK
jgi:hypothetical protein